LASVVGLQSLYTFLDISYLEAKFFIKIKYVLHQHFSLKTKQKGKKEEFQGRGIVQGHPTFKQ
jgi:hypothetical protein